MAEAHASKPANEDTEYYLTVELPKSRMLFSDFDPNILRYLRLIRPDKMVQLDGGTWEVIGQDRQAVPEDPTPTYAGRGHGKENVLKVHILTDEEYRDLRAAEYDRGFAEGWNAHYAKVVE